MGGVCALMCRPSCAQVRLPAHRTFERKKRADLDVAAEAEARILSYNAVLLLLSQLPQHLHGQLLQVLC